MPSETPTESTVRKLFVQTEDAYAHDRHTSFSPHKVNLNPMPHQQSRAQSSQSLIRKQPLAALEPLSERAATALQFHRAAQPTRRAEDGGTTIVLTKPPQKHIKRVPLTHVSNFHAMSDNVLQEMKEYVARKKKTSPTKASSATTCAAIAAGGGRERSPSKFQRGLQVQMQCFLEYAHLHSKSTRHLDVHPSAAASPHREPKLSPRHAKNSSYQKLLRKLSPSITNSATTYMNLLHLLQACHLCGGRVTFCEACEKSANEYFNKFSMTELEKSYGKHLPPPDATVVADYEKYLDLRERMMKEKL
ncbi:Aste57867_16938 [Aphanomyces stellatus]|uniref:Aste57867_16938 protein n=1 Tax=Aphanomyces stellatus TaxID=120398 RepID=A0A485L6L2_9STRA|nr:hypothetical protein As57867_016880 [Aphanomyces stellatus]VFT93700.1 Aste57867_16938 [Aphanomyces stellatus]